MISVVLRVSGCLLASSGIWMPFSRVTRVEQGDGGSCTLTRVLLREMLVSAFAYFAPALSRLICPNLTLLCPHIDS